MSRSTSPLGRLKLMNPQFRFDNADGGVELYSVLTAMFQKISDNMCSRWAPGLFVTEATGESPSVDLEHDFDVSLDSLKYLVIADGVLLSKSALAAMLAVTAVDTNTLRFTNLTATPRFLEIYVFPTRTKAELADLDAEVTALLAYLQDTPVPLANNATTTIVDVSAFKAGYLEGYIEVSATTPLRAFFRCEFVKNGAGVFEISPVPTGSNGSSLASAISITSAGVVQVTLPSNAGFTAAKFKYSLRPFS